MRFGTRWNVATTDTEQWIADALAESEAMGEDERATLERLAGIVDARLEDEYEAGLGERDVDVWFDDDTDDEVAAPSKAPASDQEDR